MATVSDPKVFEFLSEIGIIDQLSTNLLERHLPRGLTMPQFAVLNLFVRLGGEHTPFELARAFQVTKGAMTNTLKKLERHGFISVKDDPADGRRKLVSITEAGRAARDSSLERLKPVIGRFGDRFAVDELDDALPFLRDVRRFLDENRDVPH